MFDYQTTGRRRRRNRVSDYNMFQTISNGDRFFRKAGTDMERKSEIVSFSVQWTLKVDGRRVQFVLCASQNNWNLFLLLFLTQWEPVSVWERKLLSIYSQRTGTQLRLLMWIYLFFLFKNKRSCCFVPRRSFIYFSSFFFFSNSWKHLISQLIFRFKLPGPRRLRCPAGSVQSDTPIITKEKNKKKVLS